LGIGEGSTTAELHPFDRRFRDKREVWEDAVRAVIPMFGDAPVEYHGPHYDFPLRNVLPKPLQKPHPPLWVACSQRDTIEAAGRWGMGALGFQFVSANEANAWVHAYYNAYTKRLNKLADYATNPNLAVVCGFMCCPTDEEANAKADGWTFFAFALRYYSTRAPGAPGSINLWDEYQAFRRSPQGEKMHAGGLIGSPETIRIKLRKFERSHVDQVILLNQAGRNTHPDICSSLELFASDVMPEFTGRDGEHQDWKRKVLDGEILLDEVDTSPEALPRPRRKPITTDA
jgi:alkanesulfonate monooxygenase SsuD/methylene tetrahydromethanopterin reductase-like flavin-dependent oxidoreductase (luciferase family)